jgi:hypothetical protein
MIPILLVLGIIYAVRIPKLYRLSPERFPQVPAEAVVKYRRLELTSIYIFLAVTWGLGLILLLLFAANQLFDVGREISDNSLLPSGIIFVAGLIASAIYGSLAGQIKKDYQISLK